MSPERVLVFDIETDGRPPQQGKLLSIGWKTDGPVHVCTPPSLEDSTHDLCWLGLQAALADPTVAKVTQTKYDARYLKLQGWEVNGPYYDTQVMAWVLNENQTLSLDALAKRYIGVTMDKRIHRSAGVLLFKCDDGLSVPLADAPLDQLVEYNARDVEATASLFEDLWNRLDQTSWLPYFLESEVPFTEVLLGMEVSGLPVNLEASEALREELEPVHARIEQELLSEGSLPETFNVNSVDQLAAFLYSPVFELVDRLPILVDLAGALKSIPRAERLDYVSGPEGLLPDRFTPTKVGRLYIEGLWTLPGRNLIPTEKTKSGKRWSTSSPVLKSNLKAMQDEWVGKLLDFRKVEKLLTTYLRRFPDLALNENGETYGSAQGLLQPHPPKLGALGAFRLYGRFSQTGTKTGRLSSSEPNMQNLPAHGELGTKTRALFQGQFVVGDYSQLEPRLMAHFSEDPLLLEVYRNDRDIYLATASGIFGGDYDKDSVERGISKTLVLAMGYGAGANKVAQILTINGFPSDKGTADGYLRELQALYATFFAWRDAVITRVKQRGYVSTLGGRHRRLKAAFTDRRNWKNVGYGERQAVNAVVQGSAGDIVRCAMVACGTAVPELRLLAQVHDELVFEHFKTSALGLLSLDDGRHSPLNRLRDVAEMAHGFNLRVPLKFEPHYGTSWFAAKEGIELPEDLLAEETVGYEEE